MKTKEVKRQEAQERQAAYDALTPAEKWARVCNAPGQAARERARVGAA